jgi:hypothetical protein
LGSRDVAHFGPAHDGVEPEAAEVLGMPRDQLAEDRRVAVLTGRGIGLAEGDLPGGDASGGGQSWPCSPLPGPVRHDSRSG